MWNNISNEKVNERALDLIQEICRKLPITLNNMEYSLEKKCLYLAWFMIMIVTWEESCLSLPLIVYKETEYLSVFLK